MILSSIGIKCIVVFVTQLIFIGARTWNVRSISRRNIPAVVASGSVVHIAWLISIAIGVDSMTEIMTDFQWAYIPIVICSLAGGLTGSVLALKNK